MKKETRKEPQTSGKSLFTETQAGMRPGLSVLKGNGVFNEVSMTRP